MRLQFGCGLVCVALLAGLLLGACVRPDHRPPAVIGLVRRAGELIRHHLGGHFTDQGVNFDERYDAEGIFADDRFPDWARGEYEACVYWTDGFSIGHGYSEFVPRIRGTAWGWALINDDFEVHVLEIAYENEDTGETHILLSQWDETESPEDD